MNSACIVIPARLGSTRLPEKALALIHGKPMIQHVYERASKVKGIQTVLVATDHQKILDAVEAFGGQAMMTPEALASGTDRVAFVAESRSEEVFINVQGDEPMLDPIAVEKCLELVQSKRFLMATPAAKLQSEQAFKDLNTVKVLVRADGSAVYFSRFPIPYSRGGLPVDFFSQASQVPLHHLGVYAYSKETLLRFASLPRCAWEQAESLEQLRALYYGIPIGVALVEHATRGVDTPEDLEYVRHHLS